MHNNRNCVYINLPRCCNLSIALYIIFFMIFCNESKKKGNIIRENYFISFNK